MHRGVAAGLGEIGLDDQLGSNRDGRFGERLLVAVATIHGRDHEVRAGDGGDASMAELDQVADGLNRAVAIFDIGESDVGQVRVASDQDQRRFVANEQRQDRIVDVAAHHDQAVDVAAAQHALVEVLLAFGGDHGQEQEEAAIAARFGDALDDVREERVGEDGGRRARDEQADDVGASAGQASARRRVGYSGCPG